MDFYKNAKNVTEELATVFDKINESQITSVLKLIDDAQRIFLIGVGREGLVTRSFAMRLMHYGKEVHWCWDDTTPNVSEKDLFIATTGSGEIGHIDYVVNEIKKTGAKILVVTGVPTRKTAKIADEVLWIPAAVFKGDDNVVPSIQPMGSLFEQALFITFDLIIMELVSENAENSFEKMAERHRNFE